MTRTGSRRERPLAAATLATLAALATLASLVGSPARAADADPGAAPFLAAQADFQRGLDGDAAANQRAHAAFQKLVDAEPTHPLYLAYLGSTYAVLGREAWAPWTKMRQTERGLGLLDKALSLLAAEHDLQAFRGVPVSMEVRLNAASAFLAVPGFMNRTEAARLAVADALASPAFAITPGPVRARLLLQASLLAQRSRKPAEEAGLLGRALAAGPDDTTAATVRARLKELGQ